MNKHEDVTCLDNYEFSKGDSFAVWKVKMKDCVNNLNFKSNLKTRKCAFIITLIHLMHILINKFQTFNYRCTCDLKWKCKPLPKESVASVDSQMRLSDTNLPDKELSTFCSDPRQLRKIINTWRMHHESKNRNF